jgi:hypothetical protein
MSQPARHESNSALPEIERIAARVLSRIGSDLLELGAGFGVDGDLFAAGLDSMGIMQVIIIVEEEFGAKFPDSAIKRQTFTTARRIAETIVTQNQTP